MGCFGGALCFRGKKYEEKKKAYHVPGELGSAVRAEQWQQGTETKEQASHRVLLSLPTAVCAAGSGPEGLCAG